MYDCIDPSQGLSCLPQSRGVQLRAVATDQHYRCIQLEPALRRERESRAEIPIPLGADLNAVWKRYATPGGIADRRRYT